MSGGFSPHRLTKAALQGTKNIVYVSLSYVFFGIISSNDDLCLEMLESFASGRPTPLCFGGLVWWNFPKEN
jgi:hypothetical protein